MGGTTRWLWVQSGAAKSPPIPCLSGKIQGIFAKCGHIVAKQHVESRINIRILGEIPYAREQGISKAIAGREINGTGTTVSGAVSVKFSHTLRRNDLVRSLLDRFERSRRIAWHVSLLNCGSTFGPFGEGIQKLRS